MLGIEICLVVWLVVVVLRRIAVLIVLGLPDLLGVGVLLVVLCLVVVRWLLDGEGLAASARLIWGTLAVQLGQLLGCPLLAQRKGHAAEEQVTAASREDGRPVARPEVGVAQQEPAAHFAREEAIVA
eukprot:15239217-Alexandrium_andersonii.AAC.1